MKTALSLVENYNSFGCHNPNTLFESINNELSLLEDALNPNYITEEEELILSYFDAYFGSDNHETYLEEKDYHNAIYALEDSIVLAEETGELNEILGMVRQAVGGLAKKALGRGNELTKLRATGDTGLGKATFAKKHLPTAVAAGRSAKQAGRNAITNAKAAAKGAIQTGRQLATGARMAAQNAKAGVKGYISKLRNKFERRKAASTLIKGREALRNQRKIARSGDANLIAKNAGERKAAASIIGQRAKGALGGSASAARQVKRARAGTSNIGLKVKKTATPVAGQRASNVRASNAGASNAGASNAVASNAARSVGAATKNLRKTVYGNQRRPLSRMQRMR